MADGIVNICAEERDRRFMALALEQARIAADEGETPVGAVCVMGDRVISTGRNHRELGRSALAHAELEAIDGACKTLGGWRLWQCELYVTLEPCPMCAGQSSTPVCAVLYTVLRTPRRAPAAVWWIFSVCPTTIDPRWYAAVWRTTARLC